jgi:branched-chain amino acid transport system permease protein
VTDLLGPAFAGLAGAAHLFLLAAGLTLVFGVCRVVNFAHGAMAMLGAYAAGSLIPLLPEGPGGFALGALLAALAVAGVGLALERSVLRHLYRGPELLPLLASFGAVLMLSDAVLYLWGPDDLVLARPGWQRGAVLVLGTRVPRWDLVVMAVGLAVGVGLWWLLARTSLGRALRASAENRDLAAALGVRQGRLSGFVFALGAGLAGLAGALMLPDGAASLGMDAPLVVDAFVVVVLGGLGSLGGAALASLLIGQVQAFGALWLPGGSLVIAFVAMALVLALRPHGLLGRPQPPRQSGGEARAMLRPVARRLRVLALPALLLAVAAPWLVGSYTLGLLDDAAIATLFAASLFLVMGIGGMPSFGHAAWFALGAYAAGWAMRAGLGGGGALAGGLVLAVLLPGAAALLLGGLVTRREGVVLAMLTLAFAQIVWAVAIQAVGLTGGDNGILGVRVGLGPAGLWWLALAVGAGGSFVLGRVGFSRFGYALRAARDAPVRAAALGLPVARLRVAGFAVAGAGAGLAGGGFAHVKGAVFPTYGAIAHSVDALVMVLLGGLDSAAGPVIGALAYTGLFEALLRLVPLWRFALGALIILMVLALPDGLAGRRRA